MSLEDRRDYPFGCYPYRNEEERDRLIAQLRAEYAHLPQFDASERFFLLPPASETAQEIGAKVPRSSFHTAPKKTGKGFATANGFARMEGEKSCGDVTGKGCSGKLLPSSKKEEQREPALPNLRLVIETTMMLAASLAECAGHLTLMTQELKQLMCQKEQ